MESARPPLPLGRAFSPCPHQRYLDEAEREKQQYMKELRAYQQSEAYKMCAEKIQEKIKKEDSSSGLMNTLLNGHKVSVPPPRRTPGRERSGVFKPPGDQGPSLMG